jgi:hypothetical protein
VEKAWSWEIGLTATFLRLVGNDAEKLAYRKPVRQTIFQNMITFG